MGGNAFNVLIPDATFPRMPAKHYAVVKPRLTSVLDQLYLKVAVPREAPEKVDFGDLDFIVFGPRDGLTHEQLKHALGADYSISCEGSRGMHQFAIPITSLLLEDWASSVGEAAFFQVDIAVCEEEEWDRVVFYTAYGDLGMILGSVARGIGLSLGRGGLKLADPLPTSPAITFRLSSSFQDIFDFFELSMEKWAGGFNTKQEIFDWVASSPYFDARKAPLQDTSSQSAKILKREARPMFQNYLQYCRLKAPHTTEEPISATNAVLTALEFFGRRPLHDLILHISAVKKHAKEAFHGGQVSDWTGLKGMPVKFVMDEVKRKLGGTELVPIDIAVDDEIDPIHFTLAKWEDGMFRLSLDEVRQLTMETKEVMDKEGRLKFDWRAAKRRKAEQKASNAFGAGST